MRIVVTGANGFVGRAVVALLAPDHEVVATDLTLPHAAAGITGDLSHPAVLHALFDRRCDAVIHLATFPGGATESDPDRGWDVNVAAVRLLAEAAARHEPRFVFASSIAALGEPGGRSYVDDATPLAPTMLYGVHKVITETWLATLGRRGAVRPLSLRLAGLVARPGNGAGLKSAFLSEVFHAARQDRAIELPVSAAATSWLMSARQAAWNLRHALAIADADLPPSYALTLPALRVRMDELVEALGRHFGRMPDVRYAPDKRIEEGFGRYPPLRTPAADALGFANDGDLDTLIASALESGP